MTEREKVLMAMLRWAWRQLRASGCSKEWPDADGRAVFCREHSMNRADKLKDLMRRFEAGEEFPVCAQGSLFCNMPEDHTH